MFKLLVCGSSPLTRGKLVTDSICPAWGRLIPAHAGKTRPGMPTARSRPAHPRSRGENVSDDGTQSRARGSSPLTRGKRSVVSEDVGHNGLIPAHAGKTIPGACAPGVSGAHPRSRGENTKSPTRYHWYHGSSPLTRGKRAWLQRWIGCGRLIPAHAGKTSQRGGPLFYSEAHPRSRGENPDSCKPGVYCVGSSPLTRGKPILAAGLAAGVGLIPAHAGKTPGPRVSLRRSEAHPRSRGENLDSANPHFRTRGSSPLTRGKPRPQAWRLYARRLIPAHAGKTATPSAASAATTAHPRSRGENFQRCLTACQMLGSSPLTRGKPREVLKIEVAARLIPAHAGKTKSRPAM